MTDDPKIIISITDIKGNIQRLLIGSLEQARAAANTAATQQKVAQSLYASIVEELKERRPDYPWAEMRTSFDPATGTITEVGPLEEPKLEAVADEGDEG
jgi:hypothetical protein